MHNIHGRPLQAGAVWQAPCHGAVSGALLVTLLHELWWPLECLDRLSPSLSHASLSLLSYDAESTDGVGCRVCISYEISPSSPFALPPSLPVITSCWLLMRVTSLTGAIWPRRGISQRREWNSHSKERSPARGRGSRSQQFQRPGGDDQVSGVGFVSLWLVCHAALCNTLSWTNQFVLK